ncbi:MAG: lipoyl(octanoyl) transferase LipB, partial [Bacteroidales bacterium]|nr:lipoyl(octanoyl) transferase LipB [Bacteroidales bacterium]
MNSTIQYADWKIIPYQEAWDRQKKLFDELIALKSDFDNPNEKCIQRFILCEHPHVYTLGKNGQVNNMLINDAFMEQINASFYRIDRGGDITYHGPGQIVGYPILDLQQLNLSLKEYVHCIEEMIILTLKDYHIPASRMSGATGVWLDANMKNARKICAIGIRASRYVTMH